MATIRASLRLSGLLLTAACLGGAPILPAAAQSYGSRVGRPVVTGTQEEKPQQAPAPAIPGAVSPGQPETRAGAGPGEHPTLDMPPTEALFDAINRGDIANARDALNRGADLNGHNVLGMTPLDLSIDLGRKDITFLLLSMRGAAPSGRPPSAAKAAAAPSPAELKAARAAELKAEKAARARAASVRVPVADRGPPAARTAPLYAGNGGTPIPQAGFLGFDSVQR